MVDNFDVAKTVTGGADQVKSDPVEQLKWTGGHYSGKAFRFHFILLVLLTLAFYLLAMKFGGSAYQKMGHWAFWGMAMAVPIVLWVRYFIKYFYLTTTISYELHPDRLITKKGLFVRSTDTTLILRINDVKLVQSLWDRIFNGGIGTVMIYSSDPTDGVLALRALEKPQDAFNAIDHLVSETTRKKGFKSLGGNFNDMQDASLLS